jgi:outer membrane protein assembly factor BamB
VEVPQVKFKRPVTLAIIGLLLFPGIVQAADWPTFMHDLTRTGNQNGESILSPSNAGQLTMLWRFKTGGIVGAQAAVVNNVVYVASWDGYEYAINALTGQQIWKSPFLGITNGGPTCFPAVEGPDSSAAVDPSSGTLYLGGGDNNFYALNMSDGSIKWKTPLWASTTYDGHFNWSSPLLYNGYLYIGIASVGDCPLIQGGMDQLNAATGQIVNTVNFVPNGQVGAGVWTSPSIDTSTGTVFVTTGTRVTATQTEAQAMIALNASNLAIEGDWPIPENQQVQDADWGTTPLFYHDANGNSRVYAVNKNGIAYAFNSTNVSAGPVWQTQLDPGGNSPSDTGTAAYDGVNTIFQGASKTTLNGQTCIGTFNAINATTGAYIWRQCDHDLTYQAMAYSNGLVFDGTGSDFEVRAASTGNILFDWSTSTNLIYGAPAISNGRVFFGMTDGYEYAFGLPPSAATPTPLPTATQVITSLQPGQVDLSAFYNNAATSDDGVNEGSFDTFHSSYSAQALQAVGITPGSQVSSNGVAFLWPTPPSGANNNVMALGQTLTLPTPLAGLSLNILGAATSGPGWGPATINYSDGTTQPFTLAFSDWTLNGGGATPYPGNTLVATTAYMNTSGAMVTTSHPSVFSVSEPIQAGKPIVSLTLPPEVNGLLHLFAITVSATSQGGVPSPTPTMTSVPTSTTVVPPTATQIGGGQGSSVDLSAFYNNVGWTADGSTLGSFDTFHSSYSETALSNAGITDGAQLTYNGIKFQWPNTQEGGNDNVMGVGQTFTLQTGVSGSQIALLGAASSGPWSGNLTLQYGDGTTQVDPITLDDWCTSAADPGQSIVATTGYRLLNGAQVTSCKPVVLMTSVPANPAKTITGFTMPEAGGGQIHFFAMTVLGGGTGGAGPTPTAIPTSTTVGAPIATSTTVPPVVPYPPPPPAPNPPPPAAPGPVFFPPASGATPSETPSPTAIPPTDTSSPTDVPTSPPAATFTSVPVPPAATATATAVSTPVLVKPLQPSAQVHIVVSNNPRTVVGGRRLACNAMVSAKGSLLAGCEAIAVLTAPGAQVTYTITYANGSVQRFVAAADGKGRSQHVFAVAYLPPMPNGLHSIAPYSLRTVARVTIQVTLKDGTRLAPISLRFAVTRQS